MRFLARLATGLFSNSSDVKPSSPTQAKLSNVTTQPEYCDDRILRQMAKEYEDGRTTWVFASDMYELFKKLDDYNGVQGSKIKIMISRRDNDFLNSCVQSGAHLNKDSIRQKGPLVLNGENMLHYLGPQYIEGLKISNGDTMYDAVYEAGAHNTGLQIRGLSGKWVSLQFGMDDFPTKPKELYRNTAFIPT